MTTKMQQGYSICGIISCKIQKRRRSNPHSFTFANRGPANQVGGQVRLQPTGLVAIMHSTTNDSRDEIEEEEPEKKEPCSAYDVNVRTSDVFAGALANEIQLAIDNDFMAAL